MDEDREVKRGSGWTFFMAPNWIIDCDLSIHAKMAYLCLARYLNRKSGVSFPSMDTIAKNMGVGRTTAWKGIEELIAEGLVKKEIEKTPKGRRNYYVLDVPSHKEGVVHNMNDGSFSSRTMGRSGGERRVVQEVNNNYINLNESHTNETRDSKKSRTYFSESSNQEQEGEKVKYSSEISEVVSFLNELTGKSFRESTQATQKMIRGRLREGFGVADFKRVISFKTQEWKGTKMEQFLRPITLFSPSKFESYLNSAPLPEEEKSYAFMKTDYDEELQARIAERQKRTEEEQKARDEERRANMMKGNSVFKEILERHTDE